MPGIDRRPHVRQFLDQLPDLFGTQRDRLAAGLDYKVNLKAEIEILELHVKLDRILSEHLDELLGTQREQLRLLTRLAVTLARFALDCDFAAH